MDSPRGAGPSRGVEPSPGPPLRSPDQAGSTPSLHGKSSEEVQKIQGSSHSDAQGAEPEGASQRAEAQRLLQEALSSWKEAQDVLQEVKELQSQTLRRQRRRTYEKMSLEVNRSGGGAKEEKIKTSEEQEEDVKRSGEQEELETSAAEDEEEEEKEEVAEKSGAEDEEVERSGDKAEDEEVKRSVGLEKEVKLSEGGAKEDAPTSSPEEEQEES